VTDSDLTLAVLREIRDELKSTRADLSSRIDQTNERLDQTNERLDQTNERLSGLEGAMQDLAVQQRFVVKWLKAGTRRDHKLEADVAELRARVGVLEERVLDDRE
jgi:chromosome segregation ATPase